MEQQSPSTESRGSQRARGVLVRGRTFMSSSTKGILHFFSWLLLLSSQQGNWERILLAQTGVTHLITPKWGLLFCLFSRNNTRLPYKGVSVKISVSLVCFGAPWTGNLPTSPNQLPKDTFFNFWKAFFLEQQYSNLHLHRTCLAEKCSQGLLSSFTEPWEAGTQDMPSLRRRQSALRRTESFAQEQAGCSLSRKTLLSSPVRTQSYRGAVPTKKQPLFPKIFPPSGSGYSVLLEHLWHSSLHYISFFAQGCTRHKTWEVLHLPSRKIKHFFYNTVEKVKKKQSDRLGIQSDAAQECKTWYDDCSTMLP